MKEVLARIAAHAQRRPTVPALTDPTVPALADSERTLDYATLWQQVETLAAQLDGRRIAYLLANGCAWALIDLAVQYRGATGIPIPTFFSAAQIAHLLADAAPDFILTDQPERIAVLVRGSSKMRRTVAGREVFAFVRDAAPVTALPPHTAKLTYTSGTTGQPKGVCLSGEAIERVTLSLSDAVQASAEDRALSLLPLSTLLENIGGLYAPLANGGLACVPDLASCGMQGSSGVQPERLIEALHRYAPTSIILVPQLLKVLVEARAAGITLPASLRFIAVGGAPTSPALIERARAFGLPVYEGYGLSESASVVSLNRPGDERRGSVGRPLPHVHVRIAADGEIEVAGNLFSGYLGAVSLANAYWPSGDLGYLDAEGYLFVTGRKKTAFATAYGRNVAPEWVESELTGSGAILQAAVFGEGRPFSVGVIVPHPRASQEQLSLAIDATNQRLPDYARVLAWTVGDEPFSPRNGLATATGAVNRNAIASHYAAQIEHLYAGV
ncbi:MAG: AMP-binding protein [Gammaproteobacteria bacterium]|nr:AMP-binding protein [Gammaproteobacteria bacterium]